ncbi:MAG: cystathionine gamma-synthase [Candidatus Cyclonatronum sp.]|uniref:cystathionine gamma-synthase n=1 Tax=Cyclonatronum sp. TaxID=3024185 RepID=UPI0025C438F8|nr:cystathionine gamma-synthase [Cyclonatronum sp.]MCC5933910.1 cystathionine gamma-synthase [Balneolales bacterium]MCH8486292.1 cystathionine gamma-synthase [Cyclonatronum sp.]
MKFNSKVIHAGQAPEETSGAVMPPIFQTSTYAQQAPDVHKGYDYARVGNPTRTALEKLIAGIEEAEACAAFASGCAAMDALMKMLRPGDHVVASNDLYGGTYRLFTQVFAPFGIEYSFVDMTRTENVEAALRPQTKMLWIETPTNPLLNIVDISALTGIAKPKGILTVVDNTFASPYLQQPLLLGADAVLHSTTKYLGGHSDVIGGAVATSHKAILENLRFQVKCTGAVPGPMDCYLTLRGIKTLSVRVERSCDNARKVAHYLREHPLVKDVRYPGFEDHPGHETAKKQMKDFGGMVSFTLKQDDIPSAHLFMQHTRLFTLAESLGGVESLISHPASMTHGSIPAEVRHKAGLNDSLIRLSCGIEDGDDLVEDLGNAFNALT